MRAGGVTAIHVTICYHENFRETIANITRWNRWFQDYSDLISPALTADDVQAREARRAHRGHLRLPEPLADRGRSRPGRDLAPARRPLHAALLQQPESARDRLLRSRRSRHHAHGPRGHPRDEPGRSGDRHVAFRRALDAGSDRHCPRGRSRSRMPIRASWHPAVRNKSDDGAEGARAKAAACSASAFIRCI